MKKKFIVRIHRKKYYGIVTAVSSGFFIIASLVCMCGLGMTRIDLPDMAVSALIGFVLSIGGYASGVIIGKYKRRNGILSGLKCGLWLWGIISVFGIVYMREIAFAPIVRNFLFLCIPSVIGGIYGVNSKMRRPPY